MRFRLEIELAGADMRTRSQIAGALLRVAGTLTSGAATQVMFDPITVALASEQIRDVNGHTVG